MRTTNAENITVQPGSIQSCSLASSNNLIGYEVLPGIGWDNLLNHERGDIIDFKYFKCRTTRDGRFLIPDDIFVVPIKSSKVDISSEIFDHFSDFTSTTSFSINSGATGVVPVDEVPISIGGSFSLELQNVKKNQIDLNTFTTRVQARYGRYTATLHPEAKLNDGFKKRLFSIARHMLFGKNRTAAYETQLLIRDYGTHILTSVDAGASVVKIDHISRSLMAQGTMDRSSVSMSATVGFPGILGVSMSSQYEQATAHKEQYNQMTNHSSIVSYGGPAFVPDGFSLANWTSGIDEDLVAIDRSGKPLNYLITPSTLPELPRQVVVDLSNMVETQITAFYRMNTYPGCTEIGNPKFSAKANVNDSSCTDVPLDIVFGGVYQTCKFKGDTENLCDSNELNIKNPQTGEFSCPDGFSPYPLLERSYTESKTIQHCHHFLFVHWCSNQHLSGEANYQTYWCWTKTRTNDLGYLFGGLYSSRVNNMVTQSHNCPSKFFPMKVLNDISICVSDDYGNAQPFSMPFGGLYSCSHGNPLADDKNPKSCPEHFSTHLVSIEDGCEVKFCTQLQPTEVYENVKIRLPPYTQMPMEENENDTSSYVLSHDGLTWSQTLNVDLSDIGVDGSTVLTPSKANEKLQNLLDTNPHGQAITDAVVKNYNILKPSVSRVRDPEKLVAQADTLSPASAAMSPGVVAAISVTSTLLAVAIASVFFWKVRGWRKAKRDHEMFLN